MRIFGRAPRDNWVSHAEEGARRRLKDLYGGAWHGSSWRIDEVEGVSSMGWRARGRIIVVVTLTKK